MTRLETVLPSQINHGETVIIKGEMTTLSLKDIKGNLVQGIRFKTIERVLFPRWFQGEIINYVTRV